MSSPLISVVIPAFNEEERLARSLAQITAYFTRQESSYEVLVVDDGSGDQTADVVDRFSSRAAFRTQVRLLQNETNRGKGFSARRGVLQAQGEYVLLTDADLSAPVDEIKKLSNWVIDQGFDLAIGSRSIQGAQVEVHQSMVREGSGKVFNLMMRKLTGLEHRDTQCGFKLFQMNACREIFDRLTLNGFSFDVEILYIARKWGLKVQEVPVVWRHSAGSKVRFFPDAARMALELFRIRWNDAAGKYEPNGSFQEGLPAA